jgi:hypothetical protein
MQPKALPRRAEGGRQCGHTDAPAYCAPVKARSGPDTACVVCCAVVVA